MLYGLVFCVDYHLQMFFEVRNNLFRIILPTDSHPFQSIIYSLHSTKNAPENGQK
jgi:hypothetical protein